MKNSSKVPIYVSLAIPAYLTADYNNDKMFWQVDYGANTSAYKLGDNWINSKPLNLTSSLDLCSAVASVLIVTIDYLDYNEKTEFD